MSLNSPRRPKGMVETKRLTLYLTDHDSKRLDYVANLYGISRSASMTVVLDQAFGEHSAVRSE